MKRTVAIVGFSYLTGDRISTTQADEIWTLNHAFVLTNENIQSEIERTEDQKRIDYLKKLPSLPRIDRVFEIHQLDWALRRGKYRLTKYEDWIKQAHDFPVYMQDHYPDFPSSVKYPLDEVNQNIFSYLLRDGNPNPYYTSSFGYMIALAIHEGTWTDIEIHGVDMGNETEFGYQKPAGELMIGVAMGRNITVHLHPDTQLCKAQLYGYDRVPSASRGRAEELLEMYRREHARYMQEQHSQAEILNGGITRDASGYMEACAYGAMYAGAIQLLERQLSGDEYYFGRQSLETLRHNHFQEEEKWLAETNRRHAQFDAYSKIDTDGQTGKVWQEFIEARNQMYALSGARQVAQKLIDECDMRVVTDQLRLEVRDDG